MSAFRFSHRCKLYAHLFHKHVNIAQKTLSTLVEVVIAGIMCYMFKTRQTGMDRCVHARASYDSNADMLDDRTDSMLYRLIVFAASRGLIMRYAKHFTYLPINRYFFD